MSDQLGITPGGYRPGSLVHHIPSGHTIDGSAGRLREIDAAGKVVTDFGPLPQRSSSTPLMPANVLHLEEAVIKYPGIKMAAHLQKHAIAVEPSTAVPDLGSGWIAFSSCAPKGIITSFKTTWVVPPAPESDSGQLVYLFNGIQNSSMIYQPVLQWGQSPAGGGNYWAIASWYADGKGGPAFHSNLVRVEPGTELTGIITLTGDSNQYTVGNNTTKSTPFVTPDGWVWFQGTDNKLWKVFEDGSQQSQPGNNETLSTPFVTPDGWVWFQGTDNKLWKMFSDGSQQSQPRNNKTATSPMVVGDWVYFRGTDNRLFRMKTDGSAQNVIANDTTSSAPFVTSDGWVYFRGTDDKLWKVNSDGTGQLNVGNNKTKATPFVTPDGWVWFQGTDDKLFKVFNDGSQQSQPGNNKTAASPVVFGGWVYFRGTDNKLFKMQTDGTQQSVLAGNTTSATPAPTSDSVFFRGTDNALWRYFI